jgi:hypothetical protein
MRYGTYSRTRDRGSPASRAARSRALNSAPAFVHGHRAGLGLELRLHGRVVLLAGDLAHPAAGAVTHDVDDELGRLPAGLRERREL